MALLQLHSFFFTIISNMLLVIICSMLVLTVITLKQWTDLNSKILFPREYATIVKETVLPLACDQVQTGDYKSLQKEVESLREDHRKLVKYLHDINVIRTEVLYARCNEPQEVW